LVAFRLLIIFIALLPTTLLVNGILAKSIVAVFSSALLACVGIFATATDINVAASKSRWVPLAVAIPAVWMIIQILPVPYQISHSIWSTSAPPLQEPIWGHITVDLGLTFAALANYLSLLALSVVAILVAKDRKSADAVLAALSIVTTLSVIALLVLKYADPVVVPEAERSSASGELAAMSTIGAILTLAKMFCVTERRQNHRGQPLSPLWHAWRFYIVLLGVCSGGLIVSSNLNVSCAAAFGLATLILVQIIRRFSRSTWATALLLTTAALAAIMLVSWGYNSSRSTSPFLQYATNNPSDAVSTTQRMLSDSGLAGSGAGTYQALLPIYQGLAGPHGGPPNTASVLAIELGWPITLFLCALGIALIVQLIRAALIRGRDSFFSAAAAACLVNIFAEAFCDASLLNVGIGAILAITVGLGLAQSVSQRMKL
jgi:hypothetical protein